MPPVFGIFLLAGSALAFLGALFTAPVVAHLARQLGVVDKPEGERKRHGRVVPLLGGLAVFVPVLVIVALFLEQGVFSGEHFGPGIPTRSLLGLLLGGAILMVGGALDDRYRLRPAAQFVFPLAAAVVAVALGVHIPYVRSPLTGEILSLEWTVLPFLGGVTWPADPLTVLWLLALMYTTKFLDGLDGLVSGLTAIAATVIFFVALRPEVGQPATAVLALVLAGAFVGFLPWNWHPARVFLGEGGSLFAGYAIGILAVISGSKVATTLLVFGIPLLDVGWVVVQRIFLLKVSPARGDRTHLHFRLVDAGLRVPAAVLLLYAAALVFGLVGLFAQTRTKAIAFAILAVIMAAGVWMLFRGFRARKA